MNSVLSNQTRSHIALPWVLLNGAQPHLQATTVSRSVYVLTSAVDNQWRNA